MHSLFVDYLPEDVGLLWFRKFFSNFGFVKDSFIPMKRSRLSGCKFGFIRYEFEEEARRAIDKANGLRIDNRCLVVKIANFDKKMETRNTFQVANSSDSSLRRHQKCILLSHPLSWGYNEERPTYAQVTRGVECIGEKSTTKSIQCQSMGNGWLFRSAIAKTCKLVSAKDLEYVFVSEKIRDVQIKAIGGRYVIVTFANVDTRDKILKERWVKNWFIDFQPWNGEQAKDERFAWISCFGMPLSAWSSQTFKDIGNIWGDFLEVDENTLKGGSYEKGKILIATDQSQRIEGNVDLIVDGMRYTVRIEEEHSFRKVESSNFLAENDPVCIHEDKISQVPKEAQTLEKGTEKELNGSSFKSNQDLKSFVEESMGLESLFYEAHDVEPAVKTRCHEKVFDVNSEDSISIVKAISGGSDYDNWDLVSNQPLIKYVEHMRHKKTHKSKKENRRKSFWSKNPLKPVLFSRTVCRDNVRNATRMGSKKRNSDGSIDGPTHSILEEVSSDIRKRYSELIKEARDNMKLGVRLGVKFHGRESYNIKKFLELDGVEISEQEIIAEIKILDLLEGDESISAEFRIAVYTLVGDFWL